MLPYLLKQSFLAAAVFVFCFCTVFTPAAEKAQPKASPEAVESLFKALNMQETFNNTISVMIDAQIKQQPQLAPLRTVMEKFFLKYASWDKIKKQMADIYAKEFTDSELAEITTFLTTDAGKKWVEKQPRILSQANLLSQKIAQKHMPELQKEIMQAMLKMQQDAAKPAAGTKEKDEEDF